MHEKYENDFTVVLGDCSDRERRPPFAMGVRDGCGDVFLLVPQLHDFDDASTRINGSHRFPKLSSFSPSLTATVLCAEKASKTSKGLSNVIDGDLRLLINGTRTALIHQHIMSEVM
jgi:hypothetical protein